MDKDSRNHGAYAQVTVPLEGEDPDVTLKPGGKKEGICRPCTRTKLFIIGGILIVIVVIAILIGVFTPSSKPQKNTQLISSTVASTVSNSPEMKTSAMSQSETSMATTTQPPATTTTFGPPVAGAFSGALVIDIMFQGYFDDMRAKVTEDLKNNITDAIDAVYSDASAPYQYVSSTVDHFLANDTNTQVMFTVLLNAINRGAPQHLLNFIGPVPSNNMNTYTVLYTHIGEEEPDVLSPP